MFLNVPVREMLATMLFLWPVCVGKKPVGQNNEGKRVKSTPAGEPNARVEVEKIMYIENCTTYSIYF